MSVERARLQRNFSRAAARYDALATYQHSLMRRGLDWALAIFPERAQLLDVGCGTGLFAEEASAQRPGWRIACLDLSPGMCDAARKRTGAVTQADAVSLPFASASMDGVFSSLCLQWVEDRPAALREIARVLKPGASAVLVTLTKETLRELKALAGSGELGLLPMEPVATYRAQAQAAGLDIERERSDIETLYYTSAFGLLSAMRDIGAGNAMRERANHFAPRYRLSRLIAEYERRHATPQGVAASWQPLFLALKKPA
ncbi:MAG: methyltransferase domain-containing protein [Alphaproteobacteria bacterium]